MGEKSNAGAPIRWWAPWLVVTISALAVLATAWASLANRGASTHLRLVIAPQVWKTPPAYSGVPVPGDHYEKEAYAQAGAILEGLTMPKGTVQVRGSSFPLFNSPPQYAAPYYVDEATFWRIPGTVRTLESFLLTHRVKNEVARSEQGAIPYSPNPSAVFMYMLAVAPYSPVSVQGPVLLFELVAIAPDTVAARVDAQVFYSPQRPVSELIPSGSTSVAIRVIQTIPTPESASPGMPTNAGPTLRTVFSRDFSDRATMRYLVSSVNALRLWPFPAMIGGFVAPPLGSEDISVQLTFGPSGISFEQGCYVYRRPDCAPVIDVTSGQAQLPPLLGDLLVFIRPYYHVPIPALPAPPILPPTSRGSSTTTCPSIGPAIGQGTC